MRKPSDWEILAVALMRRLGGKVELNRDELQEACERLHPLEYETVLVSYEASRLAGPWEPLTVELRSRPRDVPGAIDALIGEILGGSNDE